MLVNKPSISLCSFNVDAASLTSINSLLIHPVMRQRAELGTRDVSKSLGFRF